MHWFKLVFLAIAFLVPANAPPAQSADEKIGVVLMHGKWGGPKGLARTAKFLRSEGVLVDLPTMPWSRNRAYAKTYDASMEEIDAAVKRLHAKGAKRVFVGGHSMGANAALGYGARRSDLTGVVLLAPGHTPSMPGFTKRVQKSLNKARGLASRGKGKQRSKFGDVNQGKTKKVTTTAEIYLSWFDPVGPAVMPNNARNIPKGLPVFCADGSKEKFKRCSLVQMSLSASENHLFDRVTASHKGVPYAARESLLKWLRKL